MSFGLILIEVCDANAAFLPELQHLEDEFPGVSVLEASCMSECELCAKCPYVFLDGKIVSGTTFTELLEQLRVQIEQLFQVYDTEM